MKIRGTNASASVAVAAVGLRILTRSDEPPRNIVVKSSLTKGKHLCVRGEPHFSTAWNRDANMDSCFLLACGLCRKRFGPDQDIYMYSGEGYCSVKCRERKIEINEMKKLQMSTERMTVLPWHCSRRSHSPAATEARLLREELRQQRDLVIAPKTRTLLYSLDTVAL